LPIASTEIARAEKIVRHATGENPDRQKQSLMQKERAIQKQRGAKKRENDGSPGRDNPFERKLERKSATMVAVPK